MIMHVLIGSMGGCLTRRPKSLIAASLSPIVFFVIFSKCDFKSSSPLEIKIYENKLFVPMSSSRRIQTAKASQSTRKN